MNRKKELTKWFNVMVITNQINNYNTIEGGLLSTPTKILYRPQFPLLLSYDLRMFNVWMLQIHSIATIRQRNNRRTLRSIKRAQKAQKKSYVLLGNPLISGRAIECLKHCHRIWVDGENVLQWLLVGRGVVWRVAHAGLRSTTHDIAFLFHNFFTMETQQRRRAKTMRPEAKTARKPFIFYLLSQNKIGCKLK